MRTIKFKAKRINNGDWVVGSLAIHGKRAEILPEEHIGLPLAVFEKVAPTTVCQFTGFLDKNGKEIYEGDVLRSDSYPYSCFEDIERDNYFAVVFYCEDGASFATVTVKNPESNVGGIADGICNDVWREEMKRFEVVGNIHEEKWQQYGEYFKTEEGKEADND